MKPVKDISSPIRPTGDGMGENIGPGAWANRADHPDMTFHGTPKIVPMRVATTFSIAEEDPDPRGMPVIGCDGSVGGTVVDIWVDRSEPQIRYYELETQGTHRRVLLPLGFAKLIRSEREIRVKAIAGHHFEKVPGTKSPDQITLLEEDQIMGYFGGGFLYASPDRQESIL